MRYPWLCLALTLVGCQASNPYQQAQPVPPPNAATPVDLASYPAAPIDYARFRSWTWHDEPNAVQGLEAGQIREVVREALDQRGLRPAAPGQPADLAVNARVSRETRMRQVYDDYGYAYPGYGHSRHYGGYYGRHPISRSYQEEVIAVRLDLEEAATGQRLWQGSAEALADRQRPVEALRQAVKRALDDYPPR